MGNIKRILVFLRVIQKERLSNLPILLTISVILPLVFIVPYSSADPSLTITLSSQETLWVDANT